MDKKRRSLNIVDIAIIFALIAIIGGAVFRTYVNNNVFISEEKVSIEYVLEIKSTEKEFRNLINNGDLIYAVSNNAPCGTIVSCQKNPSKTYVTDNEEQLLIKYNPANIDINITVTSKAKRLSDGYIVGDNIKICVGLTEQFRTDGFMFTSQIKSIKEVSSNSIG